LVVESGLGWFLSYLHSAAQGTKVAAIWLLTLIPTEKDAATEGKKCEVPNGWLDIKRRNMWWFQPLKRAATALKKTGRTKIKPG
jgi:hypothetical protein